MPLSVKTIDLCGGLFRLKDFTRTSQRLSCHRTKCTVLWTRTGIGQACHEELEAGQDTGNLSSFCKLFDE